MKMQVVKVVGVVKVVLIDTLRAGSRLFVFYLILCLFHRY